MAFLKVKKYVAFPFLVFDQINLCHHLHDNNKDNNLAVFCNIQSSRNVTTTQCNVHLLEGRMHT